MDARIFVGQLINGRNKSFCSIRNYGLTEGQGIVGAKGGGKCMGTYIDDQRAHGPLAPRGVGRKRRICGVASAQWVYGPGFRRWLLAAGAFAAHQS